MRRFSLLAAASVAVASLVAGCGNDNTAGPDPDPVGTVRIELDHVIAGEGLVFDAGTYTNAADETYGVSKLQYLVSHFTLHRSEGDLRDEGDFEADVAHFRDGRVDGTRTLTIENVPAGLYSSLSFTFGLDEAHNVAGAYPEYDQEMAWPEMLGGGYHYMKLEGTYNGSSSFVTHMGHNHDGSQNLTAHSFEVELDLDPAGGLRHGAIEVHEGETTTIEVLMDVNEWYQSPNTISLDTQQAGIMMDHQRQQTLSANGEADAQGLGGVFSTLPVGRP